MVDPLLGFPDQSYLQGDPMLFPKKPTFASLLADLDADIERRAEELKAFDISGPDLTLPRQPMPSMLEAIGAALSNIVQPGAAQEFAQYANQVKRTNTQIAMQEAVAARDAAREELGRKFGIPMAMFEDAMRLRSELREMQLKSSLGIGGMDPVTLRDQGDEIMKKIAEGSPIEVFLNDPTSLGIIKWKLGLGPESTTKDVLEVLKTSQETMIRERQIREENLAERKKSGQRDEVRLGEIIAENDTKAVEGAIANRNLITDINTAIIEAESKLEPSIIEKLIRGTPDEIDENDPRLDETIRLKTMIDGKEKITLRKLRELYRNAATELNARFQIRPNLLNLINGVSPQVPTTPQVQQPAPASDSLPNPADVLRFGG